MENVLRSEYSSLLLLYNLLLSHNSLIALNQAHIGSVLFHSAVLIGRVHIEQLQNGKITFVIAIE